MPASPRFTLSVALILAALLAGPAARAGDETPPPTPAAKVDAKADAPDRRPTLAVLYFDYGGPNEALTVLRKGLAQMLISDLAEVERVRLVERDRLQEILAELELSASKKVDAATAAKIGRLLGARYLVMGGYFDLAGAIRVDARVVEVETGRIVKSVGVTGAPGDFLGVEQQVAQRLRAVMEAELPPMPEPEPATKGEEPESKTEKKPPRRKPRRPKPPEKLETETAIRYSEALDAKDRGDKAAAKEALEKVVEAQPDFELARIDLASLMQ